MYGVLRSGGRVDEGDEWGCSLYLSAVNNC